MGGGQEAAGDQKTMLVARAQRSRAGLSTAYSMQRSLSKNGRVEPVNMVNQPQFYNLGADNIKSREHANRQSPQSSLPGRDRSAYSRVDNGYSNDQQSAGQHQSNWQKVSSSNQELTKLFY